MDVNTGRLDNSTRNVFLTCQYGICFDRNYALISIQKETDVQWIKQDFLNKNVKIRRKNIKYIGTPFCL